MRKIDILEDQEFYELMQSYRHAEIGRPIFVLQRYEAVKKYIRNNIKQIGEKNDITGNEEST